jgi:glycosyltransferase involved in cell wall biosynthesis
MPSFLLISYVFPPVGGAGVQRALKLVKYIGRHGWRPVVCTPRRAVAPVSDESYLADLPPEAVVRRLPNLEPGGGGHGQGAGGGGRGLGGLGARLLFPDRYVLWLPAAVYGAARAARRHRARAVVVTAPPFSSFVLGRAVAAAAGLPLVLDFRDDWSGFFSQGWAAHGGGRLWRRLVLSLERRLVRSAARVVATTPDIAHRLRRLHGGPAEKFAWIPNGYDPADVPFAGPPPPPPEDGRLHLLYAGTVFQSHPLDDLWAGLGRLSPEMRRRAALTVVGRAVAGQVVDPGLEGLAVRVLPYEPHDRVLERMARSHALVMTLAGLPGLERMVPAKLFEHLAVRRPTLAIVPPGPAAALVREAEAGRVVAPGDGAGAAAVLAEWLQRPPAPLGPPPPQYDRARLAGLWARLLEEAAGRAGPGC